MSATHIAKLETAFNQNEVDMKVNLTESQLRDIGDTWSIDVGYFDSMMDQLYGNASQLKIQSLEINPREKPGEMRFRFAGYDFLSRLEFAELESVVVTTRKRDRNDPNESPVKISSVRFATLNDKVYVRGGGGSRAREQIVHSLLGVQPH